MLFDDMPDSSYLVLTYGSIYHILKVLILGTIVCDVVKLNDKNVLVQSTKASYSCGLVVTQLKRNDKVGTVHHNLVCVQQLMLGHIVISVETTARQAEEGDIVYWMIYTSYWFMVCYIFWGSIIRLVMKLKQKWRKKRSSFIQN